MALLLIIYFPLVSASSLGLVLLLELARAVNCTSTEKGVIVRRKVFSSWLVFTAFSDTH